MKTIQASLRIALVAAVALGVASCSKKPAPTTAPDTSAGQSAQAPSSAPTQVVPSDSGFPTPAPEPSPVSSDLTAGSGKSELSDVFFDFDDFTIRPDQRAVLDGDADVLRRNPRMKVLIEGHCDERGTRLYNMALGDKRANAAKEYLVALGVDASRIDTVSYGNERPFAPGHDEAAWAQNRRAHFVISQR